MSLAIRDVMETWRKHEGRHSSSMSTNWSVAVTMETAGPVMVSIALPFISLTEKRKTKF